MKNKVTTGLLTIIFTVVVFLSGCTVEYLKAPKDNQSIQKKNISQDKPQTYIPLVIIRF